MQRTHQIISDIRAHQSGTALWWLGNAGWALKSGRVLMLIDPVIEPSAEDQSISEIGLPLVRELPLQASALTEDDVAICMVTHDHGDHLARKTVSVLSERTECEFVVPVSCTATMRGLGVPDERIIEADHGQPIQCEHLTIEPGKALHGHIHGSVYAGANFQDCSYLVHDGSRTIFHPGDSVLLHEHLEMSAPDVFLASISEHNMWVRNTALLANLWKPRYVLPMHYGTYSKEIYWTVGNPESVIPHLDDEVRPHYHILEQGDTLLLE